MGENIISNFFMGGSVNNRIVSLHFFDQNLISDFILINFIACTWLKAMPFMDDMYYY